MTETQRPPTGDQPAGSRPYRPVRRRRSTALVAAAVVAVTLVLLWGADWLARWGAESLLADGVQEATGSATKPQVRIHGGVFLFQVVRGRYDRVEIDLASVSTGPLRFSSVDAELSGVHLPFHDVLVRHTNQVIIDGTREQVVLTYEDLNRYLSFTGRGVTVQPSADGTVTLTGTLTVLGKEVSASADAVLTVQDGALAVGPRRLQTETQLDRASEVLLGERFSVLVPLDALPFGQQVTDIVVQPDGLLITATGRGVVVRP